MRLKLSITLDQQLARLANQVAVQEGRSLSRLIERAVERYVEKQDDGQRTATHRDVQVQQPAGG